MFYFFVLTEQLVPKNRIHIWMLYGSETWNVEGNSFSQQFCLVSQLVDICLSTVFLLNRYFLTTESTEKMYTHKIYSNIFGLKESILCLWSFFCATTWSYIYFNKLNTLLGDEDTLKAQWNTHEFSSELLIHVAWPQIWYVSDLRPIKNWLKSDL